MIVRIYRLKWSIVRENSQRADDGFLAFEFMTINRISVLYCTALIEAEAHSYI